MDEQGRRTRGGRKKAGVVAVAVILALCLLAVMSYRSSHSISGASRSSAITEDSGATSAKHMVALEVAARNRTASGITAKNQTVRASTMASQTTAKTTAASCIVEETFEFGTLRGSAEAVALFKKSLQTGEPYYLNGEPTPVYEEARANERIIVNPTKKQMLTDLRYYAQQLRDGTYKNGEHFDMAWVRSPYGVYIAGGYNNTVNDGLKWLWVGPYLCFPDAVISGIEQIDHSELFDLKFTIQNENSEFAMNEDTTIMYERCNGWLVQIYDYERAIVRIMTEGGVDRVFRNVIPGSAGIEQGWGGSIIFAYQTEENGEAHYKLYRLTRGTITALCEKETVIGMSYDRIGVYSLFHDGRNPPEIYLALRVEDGIEIRSLGGDIIGTVSEAAYLEQNGWFFVHERMKSIHPCHAEIIGAEWWPDNWREFYDQSEWIRLTG